MAYTTMKTWASLTVLTASELNTYLRDNMEFVKSRLDGLVANGVQLNKGTQSTATGVAENVSWASASLEFGDWWTSGTTITVPAAAIPDGSTQVLVRVDFRARFASNATGARRLVIRKNGGTMVTQVVSGLGGGDSTDVQVNDTFAVSAGDTITLEVYQTSGGNLDVETATVTVVRLFPVD